MGKSRNLRRASSEDEEEGDIFDDKSEVSSESDEESGSRVEGASASSSAPAEVTKAQPTSGPPAGAATTKESGRSPESSGCVVLSKECPGGTDGRQNKEVCHERNVSRTGRGAPRGEGNRQRPKSTWQLMQEDPSFVPRETRYFLHDDRREGDEEETEREDSQPDTSVPRSTQTRVGPSRKLWTPDENMGMWKHDMWEQLQKEETEARATAYDWNKGRQGRRGGFSGDGRRGRGANWVPRGLRGGRQGGSNGNGNESWRRGWRPRGRGRGQAWDSEPRKKYVPRQSVAEP